MRKRIAINLKRRLLLSLFFILIPFLLLGCDQSSSTTTSQSTGYDYSDFTNLLVSDKDFQLIMSDTPYYLYFYGATCTHCMAIKQEVLTKIASLKSDVIFLARVNSLRDVSPDIDVTATPALVYVVDHKPVAYYDGQSTVLEQINQLN